MLRQWSGSAVLSGTLRALLLAALCVPLAAAPPSETRSGTAARPSGRVKPLVPEKVLRAFRGNREDARHRALDDVERWHLADGQLPDTLWKVIEPDLKANPLPDSLLRALRIYSTLDDPEGAARLESLLSAADRRVVMLAMQIAGERQPAGALDRLVRLREQPAYDESYAFRHVLISAVARFREPQAVEFLVSAINKSEGQLKYEIARGLAALTGENFGGNGDEWRTWWTANRDGFRVATAAAQAVDSAPQLANVPWDHVLPQFYGTPVYARRLLFVIDHSRSMLSSVDGVTRMEQAARELEGVIRKLPDGTWFDIIAYNDTEQRFRGQLVPASSYERSAAIRFIYALAAEGKTDCYDTLADSLQIDSNLEAVLFLSDGDPTVGTITDRATIVKQITQQNAMKRVSINTIAVDAEKPGEDFLKELATNNFGGFLAVR